jgi:hypothetical protein
MADRHVAVLRKLFAKEVIGEVGSPLFSAFWRAVAERRGVDVSQELPVSKRGKDELVHALHFVEDALGLGSDAYKRFMVNEHALNRVAVPELETAVSDATSVVLPPGKSSRKRPRPPRAISVFVESNAVARMSVFWVGVRATGHFYSFSKAGVLKEFHEILAEWGGSGRVVLGPFNDEYMRYNVGELVPPMSPLQPSRLRYVFAAHDPADLVKVQEALTAFTSRDSVFITLLFTPISEQHQRSSIIGLAGCMTLAP